MIHTIQLGVASEASLDFWAERLRGQGYRASAASGRCASRTTTGCASSSWSPTTATRRCAPSTRRSRPSTRSSASWARAPTAPRLDADRALLTETLGFTEVATASTASGDERHFHWAYDQRRPSAASTAPAPSTTSPGHSRDEDHLAWRSASREAGMHVTTVQRPRLLPLDLLPRAARDPVRDRHDFARLRGRRGPGAPRRGAAAAQAARAPARAARAAAHPAGQPARRRRERSSR